MSYSEKCTGKYIGEFTLYNPVEYNKLLNEGCTFEEAREKLKGTALVPGASFYPFFSYTVNGTEYIRASYHLHDHFGESVGRANLFMKGRSCNVWYDPENPGDAVVEEKNIKAEAKDVTTESSKKPMMKWIFIILGVFAAIGIIQLILSLIVVSRL